MSVKCQAHMGTMQIKSEYWTTEKGLLVFLSYVRWCFCHLEIELWIVVCSWASNYGEDSGTETSLPLITPSLLKPVPVVCTTAECKASSLLGAPGIHLTLTSAPDNKAGWPRTGQTLHPPKWWESKSLRDPGRIEWALCQRYNVSWGRKVVDYPSAVLCLNGTNCSWVIWASWAQFHSASPGIGSTKACSPRCFYTTFASKWTLAKLRTASRAAFPYSSLGLCCAA